MYSDISLNSTCNLPMISDLVMATRSPSSTAKAGKEMTDRRPASISLEVEALGSMEQRMDWGQWEKSSIKEEIISISDCAVVGGEQFRTTWQCSTSSGKTWMTDLGPPWAPKRSSSSMASRAACIHHSMRMKYSTTLLSVSVSSVP